MTTNVSQSLELLAAYRRKIDVALQQCFDEALALLSVDLSNHSQQALKYMREYSLRPAKRIRGALGAVTYDTATHEEFSSVGLQLAVVLELMQSYLLIVDDVMDKSGTRRGRPTLHKLYEADAKGFGELHEAEMLAVNAGLLTQHLANIVLARIAVPPQVLQQAFLVLHKNIAATGFGQLDDMYQRAGRPLEEADVIRKYRLKSSYYTFINPLQLGFTLAAKATPELMQACQDFGEAAGIAFQLHDDYLGVFGDPALLGKPTLDDIREGKVTLLSHYALTHAKTADQTTLLGILGNETADVADLKRVRQIFTDCGATAYNQDRALSYAKSAKKQLAAKPFKDSAFQDLLAALVDYSIERQQ